MFTSYLFFRLLSTVEFYQKRIYSKRQRNLYFARLLRRIWAAIKASIPSGSERGLAERYSQRHISMALIIVNNNSYCI